MSKLKGKRRALHEWRKAKLGSTVVALDAFLDLFNTQKRGYRTESKVGKMG